MVEQEVQTESVQFKANQTQTEAPKEEKKKEEPLRQSKIVEKPTPRQTPLKQSKTMNINLESTQTSA